MDFEYDNQGRISSITAPDLGETTFDYASGFYLSKIVEPGDRNFQVTTSDGEVTKFTDPDNSEREFTSDGEYRITDDSWGVLQTHFSYDDTTGLADSVEMGTALEVTTHDPRSVAGTAARSGISPSDADAEVTGAESC